MLDEELELESDHPLNQVRWYSFYDTVKDEVVIKMAHWSGFNNRDFVVYRNQMFQFSPATSEWHEHNSASSLFATATASHHHSCSHIIEVINNFGPEYMQVEEHLTPLGIVLCSTGSPVSPSPRFANYVFNHPGLSQIPYIGAAVKAVFQDTISTFYEQDLRTTAESAKGKLRRIEDYKNGEFGYELSIGFDTFTGTGKNLNEAAEACYKDYKEFRKRMGIV